MSEYDFAAYDRDGRLSLVAEAKLRPGVDGNWASTTRRNLLEHFGMPASTLFALVVPDRLYVWRQESPVGALPDFEIDVTELLAPYFARIGADPSSIHPSAFELLVGWWLDDLSRLPAKGDTEQLRASGLSSALAGGRVVSQATA